MNDKDTFVTRLSQDEMAKVEAQMAVRPDLAPSVDDSDELIGADDDEWTRLVGTSDKIAGKVCKNLLNAHSIMVNQQNLSIMEKAEFTAAELSIITNRYNEIHAAADESQPLKENLEAYCLSADPALSKEEAATEVAGLMAGVEELTSKYRTALTEGWDPKAQIDAMVEGMDLQQRYDFLVNALSLVHALNVRTMGEMQDVQSAVDETLETMKSGHVAVTDAACDELQESLVELLQESPLMLTHSGQIQEMMDAAGGTTATVVDFASSQYDDYRYKCEMALATWIEHKKGTLTTLPADIVPESLGVSIAAGIEQAHVLEEVATGSKTLEWAVQCLKVLGAVALTCFLGYVALVGLALVTSAFFEATILVMGTSTVAIIAAAALSFLVCWGYSSVAITAGTKVLEWSGEAYDWVVVKLRDRVYPAVKAVFTKLVSWFRSWVKGASTASTTQEALG